MSKRQIFDQVSDMEKRIGELYEQLGDLKNQLGSLLEENQRLTLENHNLRNHLNANEQVSGDGTNGTNYTKDIPGEGYDNLARLYEEGFHICNLEFGSPRRDEDCIFCLDFLSKTK
ncbi:DNA replication initiation control protein YabA [Lentibacillus sp. L22]|uniref:DNA replication initiation control protein YabA n=1 Tax=Lentibacillus TaxID=175304 RepID=UPI0022B0C5F6|nr:DNA replication initiation control protein YabA [Lentibacillus daqui]